MAQQKRDDSIPSLDDNDEAGKRKNKNQSWSPPPPQIKDIYQNHYQMTFFEASQNQPVRCMTAGGQKNRNVKVNQLDYCFPNNVSALKNRVEHGGLKKPFCQPVPQNWKDEGLEALRESGASKSIQRKYQ